MTIKAVVFDIGETLVSDRRFWEDWAAWIDVPASTFLPVLGAVVAAGRDNREVFDYFRPGFDLAAEYAKREAAGCGERIGEQDLYPDVRPSLERLRNAGLWVGVAGNQTARAAELLGALHLPADLVATSGMWDVAKPSPGFFDRIVQEVPAGLERRQILYVGDHPANDVVAARGAGLRAAHLRRGPWGHLWADTGDARTADLHAASLTQLADRLLQT